MSLIVEDGSIVVGANGYISVDEFNSYWSGRNVLFSETETEKEAAIIVATQYVDLNNNWKGLIVDLDQALSWPRYDVTDKEGRAVASNSIPAQLKSAVCEYAMRQLSESIQPDVSEQGTVKRLKKKVDVIETETEYRDDTGGYFGLKSYPMADNYLVGLTKGGVNGNFGRIGNC